MQIIHPCNAFAKRSGYESWLAALVAMKAGAVISGYVPQAGKSTVDIRMFLDQAQKDGLLIVQVPHSDFGLVSVGFRENFPSETIARLETESKAAEQRVLGQYKTYQS